MELVGNVQTYAWGKWGNFSTVAKIAGSNNPELEVDESESYAEFWMGTHPNGPSTIKKTKEDLGTWIKSNPDCLGVSKCKFGDELSFLFKVLSVNKPLSIQAHPNKELAEKLHKEKPHIYKDPNHKPEMAIALTHFEVLVGFRPYDEIKNFFQVVPELRVLAKEDNVLRFLKSSDNNPNLLKDCFTAIMNQPEEKVKDKVCILLCRLKYSDHETQEAQLYRLVKRLDTEFKNDIGIFGVYLFNHIQLKPGQAIFLGPNIPHAYLSGDCMECMACSDNVVRAGLTPKLKDVATLTAMLDYTPYSPAEVLFSGLPLDECTTSFSPPIQDFTVAKIFVEKDARYKLIVKSSASIFLVISGTGKSPNLENPLTLGSVVFLPADQEFSVEATSDLTIYQASTNDILSTTP